MALTQMYSVIIEYFLVSNYSLLIITNFHTHINIAIVIYSIMINRLLCVLRHSVSWLKTVRGKIQRGLQR